MGFLDFFVLRYCASFPENVVLPEPCKPDIKMTEGVAERLMPSASPPMSSVSSSFTILTINWPGCKVVSTF